MYHTGRGITQNAEEAARWYLKAAEQGLLQAQADLGAMHLAQSGVKYDYPTALYWLRKAADRGHAVAQSNLACAYLMGGATRYSGGGIMLFGPRMGVPGTLYPKDEAEAAKWLRKAADQGHVFSQFNLGYLLDKGLGVAKDHSEAVTWYRRAVDAGLVQALMNLAVLYESGIDVAKDHEVALQLRMKSSRMKIHRAQGFPILLVQWGVGTDLRYVKIDVRVQPSKDDLLMLFMPGFSIDPELNSPSSSASARSPRLEDAAAHIKRGIVWASKGDNDRAIAEFDEAIRINPHYAVAYFSRGVIWNAKGDSERAIADLNEVIRLDPKIAAAHNE